MPIWTIYTYIPQDSGAQCIVGSPPYLLNPQIIGAEDDYFDSQQEQVSEMSRKWILFLSSSGIDPRFSPRQIDGPCSCFQSIDSLKSRPAHLAVFLHHVVSQFDPAPLVLAQRTDTRHRLRRW